MTDDLNSSDITALKNLDTEDFTSTTELMENEEVQKNWSREYASRRLGQLADEDYLKTRGKNPYNWKLTPKGREALAKQEESPIEERFGEKGLNYGKKVSLFEEFFSEVFDAEIFVEADRKNYFSISYEKLDRFNFELADELTENFDTTIEALKEGFSESAIPHSINFEPGDFHTVVVDVPEEDSVSVSNLRAKHLGKFISVEGTLDLASQIKPEIVSGIFKCIQCGDRYEKEQDSSKLKSPYKCECGSRKFELVEKKMTDTMMARLSAKTAEQGNAKLNIRFTGNAANLFDNLTEKIGKNVRITGYLDEKPKKNSKKFDYYLEANNVEFIGENLELEPLSKRRKRELEALRNDYDWKEWLDLMTKRIGAEKNIKYVKTMKKSFLVWILGRNDVKGSEIENLHVLIVGEPGTAKSEIIEWFEANFPDVGKAIGKSSTGVGITAAVVKDDFTDEFVAEAGLIPRHHGGFAAIDEFDKMKDEDYNSLLQIMAQNKFKLDKANIEAELSADVGVLAASNPKISTFDPYEPILHQIPIDSDQDAVLNRFSFILAVKNKGDGTTDRDNEIADAVLRQGEDQEFLEKNNDFQDPEVSLEDFVDFTRYAQTLEPNTPKYLREVIKDRFFDRKQMTDDEGNRALMNWRQLKGMKQVARALARLDLSEKVKERHVDSMIEFFDEVDKTTGIYESNIASSEENTEQRESYRLGLKMTTMLKKMDGQNEPVDIDDLFSRFDVEDEKLEKVLNRKIGDGEWFEPKQDKVQIT